MSAVVGCTAGLRSGDGALRPRAGGAPTAQGWLAGARTAGSETVTPDGTQLNTTAANGIYAGYSNYDFGIQIAPRDVFPTRFKNPLFPVLDRAAGFTLTITAQLAGLANDGPNGPDRGGFNITLLGADREGIEIGFQRAGSLRRMASPSSPARRQ